MVICIFLKSGMVKLLKSSHNVVNVKNFVTSDNNSSVIQYISIFNLDFD